MNIEGMLETYILNDLADDFANKRTIRVGDRRFRLAYLDETPGIDDDALVLIDLESRELFEVEIYGVDVRKIEAAPNNDPGPDQLPLEQN